MGCVKSKGDAGAGDAPLAPLDLTGLDAATKFETILPFKRCKVDLLEAKLKNATGEEKTVTLEKLREIFAGDKVWADINDDNSLLVKVLKSEYFKDDDKEFHISRDALILYAVLLSQGDAKTKARVFYDVLQDNNQEFISANDKDFEVSLNKLIDLATKMLYSHLHIVDASAQPALDPSNFSKIDDKREEISEAFLDDVFGAASKLTRKDYEAKLVATQKWLFDTKQARAKIEKLVQ